MLAHAIRPKQLRALLLLLVLVPLVPTVLLLRFLSDTATGEREAARHGAGELYQKVLAGSGPTLARSLAAHPAAATPEDARVFYQELFGRDTIVRIVSEHGQPLAGEKSLPGAPLAQTSLFSAIGLPWEVQIYATPEADFGVVISERVRTYAGSAALLILAIFAIAAATGLTLNRQLTLQDLKSTAVATVAHELRTPLASIRMLVDTMREGRCRSGKQQQEYLEMIASELERLTRVTEQFLTHSRLDRGHHGFHFAPVAPAEVAEAAAHVLHERLESPDCHFTLQLFPTLPLVSADRSALVMVLVNLLENALKYTGAEKTITLRVRGSAKAVVFEVMDNGIGMSPAESRAIFQPFRQTDQRLSRSREGCGLGLSIVRQIVEAHGGRVAVDSKLGRGSCFTIRLPALHLAAASAQNSSPATAVTHL